MDGRSPQYPQQQQHYPPQQSHSNPLGNDLLEVPQDMEQVYHNHKVVAFPPSRGRTSVKEMANQSSAQKPFEPRRPRSLSAGRPRINHNNNDNSNLDTQSDIVQNVYDRMGFDAAAAPAHTTGNDWATQSDTGAAATAPHFVSLRGKNNSNNNTARNASSSYQDEAHILSPPRLNEGYSMDTPAVTGANNINTIEATTTVVNPELQTSGSFQDRYRHAVSRGRSTRLDHPTSPTPEEQPSRARSLSRGRQRMNSMWPPPSSSFSSPPPADTMQPSPTPLQNSYNATSQQQHYQQQPSVSSASSQPVISRLSPVPGIAPSASFSRGGISKASPRTNVVQAPSPLLQNHKGSSLARSPSWTSNQPSQATAGSYTGEEKKEDQQALAAAAEATPLSLKDRLHVYQAAGGGSAKGKSRSVPRQTRNVDPSTYAAQFAVRQHPPKIDIYAEIKREQEQQQQGHVAASQQTAPSHSSMAESEAAKPTDEMAAEPDAPPAASSALPFKSSNPYRSVSPQRRKNNNLANSFLASINNNSNNNSANRAPVTQQPAPPSSSYSNSYTNNSKPPPPVAEINVTESHDTGAGNDGNSVTGLMSAMSNEEFSVHKKPWQEQQQQQQHRRTLSSSNMRGTTNNNANKIKPVSSFGYTPAAMTQNTTSAALSNNHNNSSASLTPEMERLIEERVQARVADLELQIEHKLRSLVSQMEDKIMERLDTLEHKMTAAVTKKK